MAFMNQQAATPSWNMGGTSGAVGGGANSEVDFVEAPQIHSSVSIYEQSVISCGKTFLGGMF